MELTQAVRRAVQINPRGFATIDGDRRRSWTQFADRVARLAGALRVRGVNAGDRVAMLALNSDRYVEYYYAVLWLGAVVVPINTRWSLAEMQFCVQDAAPRILLFDTHFCEQADAIRQAQSVLQHPIFAGEGVCPEWATNYEELIRAADAVDDVRCGGRSLATIMYTGGTTGTPKGVMLCHAGIASNVLATLHYFGVDERTTYLHAAPMFHLADAIMLFSITGASGTHVTIPAFAPDKVAQAIAAEGVTHCLLVPTMIKMLLDHHEANAFDVSSLKRLIYGASPMPEAVLRQALTQFPAVKLVQAFGQTELSPIATVLTAEDHLAASEGKAAERLRSAGRAILAVDLKIADDEGTEQARTEIGEVWVRGPNVMLGYWNRPDATEATLVEGWVRTGDAAYMDEDGYIYVVDRFKDMIITGGENVYSAEVENAVMQYPGIAACAVIGIPDERWGERVHVVIVPKAGAMIEDEALYAHCRALIANYKCPRSMELRTEPLPLSGAGKVLKTELRRKFWDANSRSVN